MGLKEERTARNVLLLAPVNTIRIISGGVALVCTTAAVRRIGRNPPPVFSFPVFCFKQEKSDF